MIGSILKTLQPYYIKVVIGLVIIVLGMILGRLFGNLTKKLLSEIQLNKVLKNATGLSMRMETILSSIVTYFTYFIFFVWALEEIGLGSIVLNILTGGIVVVVIIAILLGVKDFIPNLVAGLFINIKGKLKPGDSIKCENVTGKIEDIELVETKVVTKKGDILYIPNSVLLKNTVIKKKKD